jgi:RNA polymerase sigma-70 factor (subfamily 1)
MALTELLVAATQGDVQALGQLLLAHFDRLQQRLAVRVPKRFRSLVAADDIVQETFVVAFREIKSFRASTPEQFYGWLVTIAERQLLDLVKALNRKKRGGEVRQVAAECGGAASSIANLLELVSDSITTPSSNAARKEARGILLVALAGLSVNQRQVILLRYGDGLSMKEVAVRLGLSLNTVRGIHDRAKKKLREAMGNSSLYFSRK